MGAGGADGLVGDDAFVAEGAGPPSLDGEPPFGDGAAGDGAVGDGAAGDGAAGDGAAGDGAAGDGAAGDGAAAIDGAGVTALVGATDGRGVGEVPPDEVTDGADSTGGANPARSSPDVAAASPAAGSGGSAPESPVSLVVDGPASPAPGEGGGSSSS